MYVCTDDDCLAGTESAEGGLWGFPSVTSYPSQPMPLGDTSFGGMECRVLATPGHTPGGVSLFFPSEYLVFTGDALFYRSIGRTDFPGGDHDCLLRSVTEVLFKLPEDAVTARPPRLATRKKAILFAVNFSYEECPCAPVQPSCRRRF